MESLTREGHSLAFEEAGCGAPPILLIHDLGSDHRSLRSQFAHFRRRHRVVAVDLPGHGKSDGLPKGPTVADFAEDLEWLCRELGLYRPTALGQGVGGTIAVELAVRYPDLLSAVVAVDAPILPGRVTRDDGAECMGLPPCLAASWDDAKAWDGAGALALCRVPFVLVETRLCHASIDWSRELAPGVIVRAVQDGRLRPREAAKRLNALIDAFLSRSECG